MTDLHVDEVVFGKEDLQTPVRPSYLCQFRIAAVPLQLQRQPQFTAMQQNTEACPVLSHSNAAECRSLPCTWKQPHACIADVGMGPAVTTMGNEAVLQGTDRRTRYRATLRVQSTILPWAHDEDCAGVTAEQTHTLCHVKRDC